MSTPLSFPEYCTERLRQRRFLKVYRRFREYTMIPATIYVDNLRLAAQVRGIPGCVVECGVWRGGMIAGLASILGAHRDYVLLDSFEGLPPVQEIDGISAKKWQDDKQGATYYNNCSAAAEYAERAMRLSGATSFRLVKGWFNQTLPAFNPPDRIALLRLDGDWYDSTMTCLESLFDHMAPEGIVVVDDYYTWDGCSRAVHDFLSRRSAVERVQSFGDVCFLRKVSPSVTSHQQ
jgi:hypothetical protein